MRLRLADGGYFDNFGIQTALDVLSQIQSKVCKERPVTLIVITTDPDAAARCGVAAGDATCPAPKTGDR